MPAVEACGQTLLAAVQDAEGSRYMAIGARRGRFVLSMATLKIAMVWMIPLPDSVAAALDPIKASPYVRRIVLFGSRAVGDAEPMSDVDIAISAPDLDNAGMARLKDAVAQTRTLYRVSLMRIEDMPAVLRTSVTTRGRVLYERP